MGYLADDEPGKGVNVVIVHRSDGRDRTTQSSLELVIPGTLRALLIDGHLDDCGRLLTIRLSTIWAW